MAAPVTVIIAWDTEFHENLPTLFPQADVRSDFVGNKPLIEENARGQRGRGAVLWGASRDRTRPTPTDLGREVSMKSRKRVILGIVIVGLALGLGIALGSRGAAPGADAGELKVTIREWDVPTKGAHPHDPAVGTDG